MKSIVLSVRSLPTSLTRMLLAGSGGGSTPAGVFGRVGNQNSFQALADSSSPAPGRIAFGSKGGQQTRPISSQFQSPGQQAFGHNSPNSSAQRNTGSKSQQNRSATKLYQLQHNTYKTQNVHQTCAQQSIASLHTDVCGQGNYYSADMLCMLCFISRRGPVQSVA